MISKTSCLQVSRNDPMAGGIVAAIVAIRSSEIGPGPLGISETSPTADAPCSMASQASSMPAMQQILTLGLVVACICHPTLYASLDLRRLGQGKAGIPAFVLLK